MHIKVKLKFNTMEKIIGRKYPLNMLESAASFVRRATRTTGKGPNIHRSNRAKQGN